MRSISASRDGKRRAQPIRRRDRHGSIRQRGGQEASGGRAAWAASAGGTLTTTAGRSGGGSVGSAAGIGSGASGSPIVTATGGRSGGRRGGRVLGPCDRERQQGDGANKAEPVKILRADRMIRTPQDTGELMIRSETVAYVRSLAGASMHLAKLTHDKLKGFNRRGGFLAWSRTGRPRRPGRRRDPVRRPPVQAEILQLAVEGRTADAEAARDGGHVTAVMGRGQSG